MLKSAITSLRCYPFLLILVVWFVATDHIYAQQHLETVHRIQAAYHRGEISAEMAVSSQLELLSTNLEAEQPEEFVKCLTPLLGIIEEARHELSPQTIDQIDRFFLKSQTTSLPSVKQVHYSPGGKFRIVYETSGSDAVPLDDLNGNSIPDYVEQVAEAADSSYRYEVQYLGFPDPIPEGSTYDIFLVDLSSWGAYGLTSNSTTGTYACESTSPATCIFVENDFTGFPPNDDPEGDTLGAIKVTLAHEFKHAIQYVQNAWEGMEILWSEMDATLMEEVVYDSVNDYYNYIEGFSNDLFAFPTATLDGSYEDVTFALYFYEQFGEFFWTHVWKHIEADPSIPFLDAIHAQLTAQNDHYQTAMLEAYMWHFASGNNYFVPGYGFEEGPFYPEPSISVVYNELQAQPIDSALLNPISARYYLNEPLLPSDGLVQLNYQSSSEYLNFGLLGYMKDGTINTILTPGNAASLSESIKTPWSWQSVTKVGLVVMNTNPEQTESYSFQFTEYFLPQLELAQNFPNPFNPTTTIRVYVPTTQDLTLTVYDVLGRPVQTLHSGMVEAGITNFIFDASGLPSGVYFYRAKGESKSLSKKMMLIK